MPVDVAADLADGAQGGRRQRSLDGDQVAVAEPVPHGAAPTRTTALGSSSARNRSSVRCRCSMARLDRLPVELDHGRRQRRVAGRDPGGAVQRSGGERQQCSRPGASGRRRARAGRCDTVARARSWLAGWIGTGSGAEGEGEPADVGDPADVDAVGRRGRATARREQLGIGGGPSGVLGAGHRMAAHERGMTGGDGQHRSLHRRDVGDRRPAAAVLRRAGPPPAGACARAGWRRRRGRRRRWASPRRCRRRRRRSAASGSASQPMAPSTARAIDPPMWPEPENADPHQVPLHCG